MLNQAVQKAIYRQVLKGTQRFFYVATDTRDSMSHLLKCWSQLHLLDPDRVKRSSTGLLVLGTNDRLF